MRKSSKKAMQKNFELRKAVGERSLNITFYQLILGNKIYPNGTFTRNTVPLGLRQRGRVSFQFLCDVSRD